MGPDDDIPDLLQEVFIRALKEIGSLRDFRSLGSWLCGIAVFVARAQIRARTRRRYLWIFSPEQTRSQHADPPSSDARRALREIYAVLDEMPVNHRMAFVLRYIQGMSLVEAAEACGTSLATVKRWLARAEKRFVETISERPALAQWLKDGTRWTTQAKA